jgi:hypothetical protein
VPAHLEKLSHTAAIILAQLAAQLAQALKAL